MSMVLRITSINLILLAQVSGMSTKLKYQDAKWSSRSEEDRRHGSRNFPRYQQQPAGYGYGYGNGYGYQNPQQPAVLIPNGQYIQRAPYPGNMPHYFRNTTLAFPYNLLPATTTQPPLPFPWNIMYPTTTPPPAFPLNVVQVLFPTTTPYYPYIRNRYNSGFGRK